MVRNIVSNALKFSPAGSVVTMHAVFVPIEREEVKVDNNNISSLQFIAQLQRVASALSISRRSSGVSNGGGITARKGTAHSLNALCQYILVMYFINTSY